jgi:cobalt-zinc-cadmium efflux system outer membrane protein
MRYLMAPLATLVALTAATLLPSISLAQALPLAAVPASAAPALTLNEAIELALQFSPQLAANQHELASGEGAVLQAGARPNPEIQALIEDTRRESRTTTLQLAQPIELGGKRSARVAVAELGQAQASVDIQARRSQVRADVAEAFYNAAIAQERVRLAQTSADLAGRAADAVTKRVTAGKVSPVEETRVNVARAGVRVELLQAEGELRSSRQRLALLLGPAAPRAQTLDWRPEVDRRQAMVDLERARRVPDLTLTLGAKRDETMGRNQTIIGIAMPLPVWDTNRGNLLQALKLHDKAEADLQAAQIRVETEWAQLNERLRSAQAEIQALRSEILPGAESAWQAAVTGFELGKFSFLETLDAQRTLLQARAQYLRALSDLYRTTSDIDRLLGSSAAPSQP